MSESPLEALTTSVITLEFCNIFLFALLLLTPAQKHPIVKALTISCLIRSALDILPPMVHKIVPQQLGLRMDFPKATNFCIVNSILLQYVTVVKAAFAVNFTLPFLLLALLQVKPKCSADDYPRLTKRTVLILCTFPFLWALPVLLTPIGRIAHGTPAYVQYNITSCYFDDPAFTVVSMIFIIVPLAVSVLISAILAFVIWRFSDTMLERAGCLFVKTKRFVRFGALVFVSMISASLWTAVLACWIRLRHTWPDDPGKWMENVGWVHMMRASVLWEAITPMLFFVIFAAQEGVYETWLGWLSRIVSLPRRRREGKNDGRTGDRLRTSQHDRLSAAQEYGIPPTCSMMAHDAEATIAVLSPQSYPAPPEKIVSRSLFSPFIRLPSYSEWDNGRTCSNPAPDGLTPAPRRGTAGTGAVEGVPRSASSRSGLFAGPSSTTFGSQFSMGSRGFASSSSDVYEAEDGGRPSTADLESLSRETTRAETPGSSRTFGRGAPGKPRL